MAVLRNIALCSVADINWCPDDGGNKNLQNIGQYLPETTSQKAAIF
jgi:hypothetical protein